MAAGTGRARPAADRPRRLFGTWRIWRDEFNEVVRTQVFDQHAAAQAELQLRFGAAAMPLRKALAVLPPRSPAATT